MRALSVFEQLVLAMPERVVKPQRYNPRPAGLPRPGSATSDVLEFLRASTGFRTHAQIMWHTKRSHSAVSWALLYLRKQNLIDCVGDAARNERYLRYRAKETATLKEQR